MKTIGLVLSYNNPAMTDRLINSIKRVFHNRMELVVLDNGSDPDKVSDYTTHLITENCRMTGGFNRGIEIIQTEYPDYDNIWFFTNDCYFILYDDKLVHCPLDIAESLLKKYPEIGILHPAEHSSVEVCYDVHHDVNIQGAKVVTEYDIVCPIFTRKAIEAMGGMFNPRLYQGWGLDHESSFLVRKAGMLVAINHLCIIGHDTSSTYDKGLDNLHPNRESYYSAAMQEMYRVFSETYGFQWPLLFAKTFTERKGEILI
jgi:hypothetical protein